MVVQQAGPVVRHVLDSSNARTYRIRRRIMVHVIGNAEGAISLHQRRIPTVDDGARVARRDRAQRKGCSIAVDGNHAAKPLFPVVLITGRKAGELMVSASI